MNADFENTKKNEELIRERNELAAERYRLVVERDGLINSKSWRYTKPLREIGAFVRRNKALYLFVKGILSIKRDGVKGTIRKIVHYMHKKKSAKKDNPAIKIGALFCESEYQENIDFSKYDPEIKVIAFYLTQFYSIPENDKWWGEGFTEWTNTRKAIPRFDGHYQPREPHDDFGYYNLLDIETIKKQIDLAKQHGIYGFCFYYYWFSGKRLLEKPLDLFLEHPELDINFCLCWANGNWTRTWDGCDKEVLIQQNHSAEDPYNFIDDIKKYIADKRYIKIDGEPIILVYTPSQIPDVRDVFDIWREQAKKNGIGGIRIWICKTFGHTAASLDIIDKVDGEVEFPPHGLPIYHPIEIEGKSGSIYDYKEVVNAVDEQFEKERAGNNRSLPPVYRTAMPGWDNTARRGLSGWTSYAGFSLRYFYTWVKLIIDEAKTKNTRDGHSVFINAWNEWGEGAYLEPDTQYGYANINTLSKALFGFSFKGKGVKKIIFVSHDAFNAGAQLLAINIIRQIKEAFGYDVYTVLKSGGTLIDDFRALSADIIILDEDKTDLKIWIKSVNTVKAICNTVVSGDILHQLTEYGITCISLIHETEEEIRQYSCEANLRFIAEDAARIVFSSEYTRKGNEKITLIPKEKAIVHSQDYFHNSVEENADFDEYIIFLLSLLRENDIKS